MTTEAKRVRNLRQRLLDITYEIGKLKATGKTAQGQKTLSIADVEDALGDMLAKHGVLAGHYSWNDEPKVVGREPTKSGGELTIWQADITLHLSNADDPADAEVARLLDVGTSPSAAVSFAIKRYYRALFHLASEEDEKREAPGGFAGGVRPVPRREGDEVVAHPIRPLPPPVRPSQPRLIADEVPPPSDEDAPAGVQR